MSFEAFSFWLRQTLLPYGGFGLMVLAMCDSSFFSLPEINDVLLMTFAINEPHNMVKYALLTTIGSLIGCALLYAVGRKGGTTFLRRSFADERLAKVQRWYQRHGILAVMYGPAAIEFVQKNYGKLGLAVAIVMIISVIVFFSFARRRVPSTEA